MRIYTKSVQFSSAQLLSCVRLFATPWTVARQAPLRMGFFRQEYWSGLPFPSPGDLPDQGIKPVSPAWQADSLSLSHLGNPNYGLPLYKNEFLLLKSERKSSRQLFRETFIH